MRAGELSECGSDHVQQLLYGRHNKTSTQRRYRKVNLVRFVSTFIDPETLVLERTLQQHNQPLLALLVVLGGVQFGQPSQFGQPVHRHIARGAAEGPGTTQSAHTHDVHSQSPEQN